MSHTMIPPKPAERGVMCGVLTPSSLEKNIFRYNDPTVLSLLNQSQQSNGLQHSHSTSSISSQQSSHLVPTGPHQYVGDKIRSGYSTTYYPVGSSGRRSPSLSSSSGVRASTLPRNNLNGSSNVLVNAGDTDDINGNLPYGGSNMIQIGLEQSKAFIRKSPTPLTKTHLSSSRSRNLNSSQLSLLSDHSIGRNAINLGIPHNDVYIPAPVVPSSHNHPNHHHHHNAAHNNNNNHNMPLNLEDLDDLLKYADEHNQGEHKQKSGLIGKGSNISIGQISNVCSSGYQSIATQSQSSSPVELGVGASQQQPHMKRNIHAQIEYNQRKIPPKPTNYNHLHHQLPPKYSSSGNSGSVSNHNNNNPPLAFRNPLYQLQKAANNNNKLSNSNKSSSLTPSSSEERLNGDYCNLDSSNYHPSQEVVPYNCVGSNSRQVNVNRLPRTNPMAQYNKSRAGDDDAVDVGPVTNSSNANGHMTRYQRRLSMESARTLSDSSTDTEGKQSI